jgi:hypothetical protein
MLLGLLPVNTSILTFWQLHEQVSVLRFCRTSRIVQTEGKKKRGELVSGCACYCHRFAHSIARQRLGKHVPTRNNRRPRNNSGSVFSMRWVRAKWL